MTPITSSAASETESARNFTPGRSGATAAITASPPPSGRWTSSSTTSGSSSWISGTASATLACLADDVDEPCRARRARPRGTARGRRRGRRGSRFALLSGAVSSISVPSPGDDVIVADPPARAHPRLDRLGDAAAIGSDGLGVEADAAIADEHARRAQARPRRRRRSRRLPRCFAALAIASRAASTTSASAASTGVARARKLDADAVRVLDLGDRLGERVREGRRLAEAAAVEPAAQLALLPARERAHAAGVVRVALDERERLQHGVVDARRDRLRARRAGCARSARETSCQTHGPRTSVSAPATAPGPMRPRDEPRWLSMTTAPAIARAIPGTKREPPGRRVAPRRASRTRPMIMSPTPKTTTSETPRASSSPISATTTSAAPRIGRRPLVQTQRAR